MERYKLTEDLEVDVLGWAETPSGVKVPLIDFPWMSAEREHQIAEEQRRKHPEIYAELDRQIEAGEYPPTPEIPVVYIHRGDKDVQ